MEKHRIVSHADWIDARKEFLDKEKAFTRLRDDISRQRRELPWERVEKNYVFDAEEGKVTLGDLFAGKSQLVVYHFMFDPGWEAGCKSCSFWADNYNGIIVHLNHRDANLVAISRAPLAKLLAYRKRMGWSFRWVSSAGNDFNFDYQVSATPEEKSSGKAMYNYELTEFPSDERPGASVFSKNAAGEVFHTYSSYGRGLDMFIGAYHFLDIAPKGRDEEGLAWSMAWVRHHDRYEGAAVDAKATYVQPKSAASCCE